MRKSVWCLVGVLVVQFLVCNISRGESAARLYQVSTITALKQGKYDGQLSFGELRKHGDFGIGTLNGLNGEMVAADGRFYQVTADGKAHLIENHRKTPFALVLFFNHARAFPLSSGTTMKNLEEELDRKLPDRDRIWAVRVKGMFRSLRVRSVPAQHKPYLPLEEALKGQREFRLDKSLGTLVGFRFPRFMNGVNVSGYHFHYIDSSGRKGGHVLDFTTHAPQVEAVEVSDLVLHFQSDN